MHRKGGQAMLNDFKIHHNLTDKQFKEVLLMATEDIKFNRISFNKKTSLHDTIDILENSIKTLRRC